MPSLHGYLVTDVVMAWSLQTIDDAEQTKERRGEISQENDNDDLSCQENLLHFLSV